ncbi:MAG: hypothetical protein DHS80DRAFT_29916 [Piptocephalis tieghemiana]|nr:MAG: hypothetical protein DHS80DRAFT_29916 [Piptocephalis tieghemiana]
MQIHARLALCLLITTTLVVPSVLSTQFKPREGGAERTTPSHIPDSRWWYNYNNTYSQPLPDTQESLQDTYIVQQIPFPSPKRAIKDSALYIVAAMVPGTFKPIHGKREMLPYGEVIEDSKALEAIPKDHPDSLEKALADVWGKSVLDGDFVILYTGAKDVNCGVSARHRFLTLGLGLSRVLLASKSISNDQREMLLMYRARFEEAIRGMVNHRKYPFKPFDV